MTEEMKLLANNMVALFKSKGYKVNREQLHQEFLKNPVTKSSYSAVLSILEEKEIIKCTDGHGRTQFLLLEKGRNYTSFDDLIASENEDEKRKRDKENIDFKNAERIYKSYPLTRVLAWIGAFSGATALLLKLAELFGILPKSK